MPFPVVEQFVVVAAAAAADNIPAVVAVAGNNLAVVVVAGSNPVVVEYTGHPSHNRAVEKPFLSTVLMVSSVM